MKRERCFATGLMLSFVIVMANAGDVESRIYKISSNIRYYQPNESKVKRDKRKKDGSLTKGPNIAGRIIEVALSGPGAKNGEGHSKKKGKKTGYPPVEGGLYVVYKKPFDQVYTYKKYPLNPGPFASGKWKKEFRVPGVVNGDMKYYHYYAAVFRGEKGVKYHGSKPGMEDYITKLDGHGEGVLFDKDGEIVEAGEMEEKTGKSSEKAEGKGETKKAGK